MRARAERGRSFSILVVAEGAKIEGLATSRTSKADEFGHALLGGIGHGLALRVEAETGFETRVTVLGHVQRGGTPTAYDRVLATRYGVRACQLVHDGEFGKMVSLAGNEIVTVDLERAVAEPKTVPADLASLAQIFFGGDRHETLADLRVARARSRRRAPRVWGGAGTAPLWFWGCARAALSIRGRRPH